MQQELCARLAGGVFLFLGGLLLAARLAAADEGGVSFWLPGQYGSFAAAPGESGWSLPMIWYHSATDAQAGKSFEIGGRIAAGLHVRADMLFIAPTYVFATPVVGGQASVGLTGLVGQVRVSTSTTLSGPLGNVITTGQSDTLNGVGDLYPSASLRWNSGVHNFMVYTMGGMPVGSYEVGRLANLGTNHWAIDAGGGYTYLDLTTGHEFSAALGFTHNGENDDTHYQNGASAHLDWAASQFLSEQLQLGVVGYFYKQLNGDSGSGAVLGDFKSQVNGIGPQLGYFFPVGGRNWFFGARAIFEFDAKNRPEGWNTWLTLAIPLGAAPK